jgi:hypothetical protein
MSSSNELKAKSIFISLHEKLQLIISGVFMDLGTTFLHFQLHRLMRPIASNMTLLVLFVAFMIIEKMFEHLHFTLVLPKCGVFAHHGDLIRTSQW